MALIVVRPGMLTTVQDLGRWGRQDRGVPVAGPMDAYSHRLANRLAGNADTAAALEVTLLGPEIETDAEIVCAVAGAHFDADGGRTCRQHAPALRDSGRRPAAFRRPALGHARDARGAWRLSVPPTFGSRAMSVVSRMGPFGGRPLVRATCSRSALLGRTTPTRLGRSASTASRAEHRRSAARGCA